MPHVTAIIQARMGSTRLPGKVLRPLVGRPMIAHVVERVRRTPGVDAVLVATSTAAGDDELAAYLTETACVPVYRGSESDVLARYYGAACEARADVVVRITADCPLISPVESGRVVQAFLAQADPCDYAANVQQRTFPRGLDTEVFSMAALARAYREARETPEREHVTPYIRLHPERFRLLSVTGNEDRSHLRWTVDTPDDFALVTRIYEALYPANAAFEYVDILSLLDRHPEWLQINAHIEQKRYGQ